jgi:hypothetical protein
MNQFRVPGVSRERLSLKLSQQNRVYELLEHAGMLPEEFQWEWTVSGSHGQFEVPRLVHANSKSYLEFDISGDGFELALSPGGEKLHETVHCEAWLTLSQEGSYDRIGAEEVVATWIELLDKELREADLWQQIRSTQEAFTTAYHTFAQHEPRLFSTEEQGAVLRSLEVLQEAVDRSAARGEITAEAICVMQSDIQRLAVQSKIQDRRGWMQTLFGTISGWVMSEYVSHRLLSHWASSLLAGIRGLLQ